MAELELKLVPNRRDSLTFVKPRRQSLSGQQIQDGRKRWTTVDTKDLLLQNEEHAGRRLSRSSSTSLEDFFTVGHLAEDLVCSLDFVKNSVTGDYFIMKKINKESIAERDQLRNLETELAALSRVSDSKFVIRLHRAFQDAHWHYLLLEAHQGGFLDTFLHHLRYPIRETSACFYAAAISLGLNHLHKRGVTYNALCPETIILDANGVTYINFFASYTSVSPNVRFFCRLQETLNYATLV
jgi:serine/threonine protein kinase